MKWNEGEIAELTELTAQGLSAGDIGLRLGKTRNAIIGKWRRLGNLVAERHPRGHTVWNPERIEQLRKMWIGGYPAREIAATMEMSLSAVDAKINRMRPNHKSHFPLRQIHAKPQKKLKPSTGKTVAFRDHRDTQCHYVIGEPNGAETLYCAYEHLDGFSYCPAHFNLCTARVVHRPSRRFLQALSRSLVVEAEKA